MGENIAKARRKNCLTQETLAEKVGISTVYVSQIETATRRPALETLNKIAETLNTTVDILIRGYSLENGGDEIGIIIKDKNANELKYIANVLREMCNGIKDGKIV